MHYGSETFLLRMGDGGMRTARLTVERDGRRVLRALDGGRPDIVLDGDNENMMLGTVVFRGARP
ncbi:MAG: hypothetical protein OXH14_19125 [Alphaproteobacteria bacterium]|nr:hypothetical protein [Alphaproteobacteria bacterium]